MAKEMTKDAQMGRGRLAAATGIHPETVRYYERIGLLPAPPRTEGGHRVYGPGHAERLHFIRRCRELGFTLDQVRGLLAFVDGGDFTCADVRRVTLSHVEEIRRKIADLERMEKVLVGIAAECDGGDVPECPIIEALSSR